MSRKREIFTRVKRISPNSSLIFALSADLIASLNKELQPIFGYELGYLKIYRVLVKNNIIIKKDKENNE